MQVSDDIYLGGFPGGGLNSATLDAPSAASSPIWKFGIGPAGRVVATNFVPLTASASNTAASQPMSAGVGLTLTAGTGVTLGTAPDGSGRAVIVFDVPRCVSLASTSDLHLINFTIVGYDYIGRRQTQTRVGPNNNTVNTLKAFKSILSITPDTTDGAHNVTAGTADIFGLPWLVADAVYVTSVRWANTLAQDAGTLVNADATGPATALTGDPRGTYAPSSASNGTNRLLLAVHLSGGQAGPQSTLANVLGVTPV